MYTPLLGPALVKSICQRELLDTWLLRPGNVHSIARTSPCKNLSQRGWRDTWLLGPGEVHSVAATSPCKNSCQRGLLDTLLLGPGNVHSIAGTCYQDQATYTLLSGPGKNLRYTWLLGLAPVALCRMPIFSTL